jgi:hypothetical protein
MFYYFNFNKTSIHTTTKLIVIYRLITSFGINWQEMKFQITPRTQLCMYIEGELPTRTPHSSERDLS